MYPQVGDVGLSETVADLSDQDKIRLRGRGTPGWYAPVSIKEYLSCVETSNLRQEQFTERWDFRDWNRSGMAGEFSSATNVWGMGVVMVSEPLFNVFDFKHAI